jgi:hypothetical protein
LGFELEVQGERAANLQGMNNLVVLRLVILLSPNRLDPLQLAKRVAGKGEMHKEI